MARTRLTSVPPTRQPAEPLTLPLASVSITLPLPRDFSAQDNKTVTLSGEDLAIALCWLAQCRKLVGVADNHSGAAVDARLGLQGLSEILIGLSQVDLSMIPADPEPIFHLLSYYGWDLAARLGAVENREKILREAVVTYQPVAEAAR